MGLVSKKKDVFTEISSLTSIKDRINLLPQTNSFSSVNNKKDVVPFLLSLLKSLVGSEKLKTLIGSLFTEFIDSVEEPIKNELLSNLLEFNSEDNIPSDFFLSGYSFKLSEIDTTQKLKNDPQSQLGSLLYNENTNDFDVKLYEAIKTPGLDITFNNIVFNYNDVLDEVVIKPSNQNVSIGDFTTDFINGLTFFNVNEILTNIFDFLNGTIAFTTNKTENQIINEEKINTVLDKIISEEESIELTEEDEITIKENASNLKNGIFSYDVGCSQIESQVNIEQLTELNTFIKNNTNSQLVGTQFINTLNNSVNTSTNTLSNNQNTVDDAFLQKLITLVLRALYKAISISISFRVFFIIVQRFKDNPNTQVDTFTFIKQNKNLFDCLSIKIKSLINEFIFSLVKRELTKLLTSVLQVLVREKIDNYIRVLTSLIGVNI